MGVNREGATMSHGQLLKPANLLRGHVDQHGVLAATHVLGPLSGVRYTTTSELLGVPTPRLTYRRRGRSGSQRVRGRVRRLSVGRRGSVDCHWVIRGSRIGLRLLYRASALKFRGHRVRQDRQPALRRETTRHTRDLLSEGRWVTNRRLSRGKCCEGGRSRLNIHYGLSLACGYAYNTNHIKVKPTLVWIRS